MSLRKYVGSNDELLRGGALLGVACMGSMFSGSRAIKFCVACLNHVGAFVLHQHSERRSRGEKCTELQIDQLRLVVITDGTAPQKARQVVALRVV